MSKHILEHFGFYVIVYVYVVHFGDLIRDVKG